MGSMLPPVANVNGFKSVVSVEHLTKRFSGIPAVSDISFSIGSGDIFGYLGPNGSGKSTTVKMLAGLLEPSEGRVLYRGESIRADPLSYKARLGYVPEEAHLYGFLTGWEYLDFVASLRELAQHTFRSKAGHLLDAFGLYSDRNTRVSAYSKGMRQRIVLIAALMHNPEILILDEPFSGLDVSTCLVLRELLKLLSASGKAIFFASPIIEMFEKVCSHVLLLRKGQQIASGPVEEIVATGMADNLESAFLSLTEDTDARRSAENILSAVMSA